eukprot:5176230-Lingulodinium_polyedra.AAC.1
MALRGHRQRRDSCADHMHACTLAVRGCMERDRTGWALTYPLERLRTGRNVHDPGPQGTC